MAVTVRAMEAGDAAAVGAFHHQSWVDTYAGDLPPSYWDTWTVAASQAMWTERLAGPAEPGLLRLVALDEGRVCGLAVAGPARAIPGIEPARDRALWGLYVGRDHHGTGLGARLLDDAIPPDEPAELWVFRGNGRAIAFYTRHGFVADGATFVDDRFPDLPEIRMVR